MVTKYPENGNVNGVIVKTGRQKGTSKADLIVLAAGGVGTAKYYPTPD